MSQHDDRKFLELYLKYRYNDQLGFYSETQALFERAKNQAIIGSIGLIFLAAITGGVVAPIADSFHVHWLKIFCLVLAALFPVASTALAAYNTLYGFEQQANLYKYAVGSLQEAERERLSEMKPNMSGEKFQQELDTYVHKVEGVFLQEQSQWGHLAEHMKASST